MTTDPALFCFDFTDPLSYLVHRELFGLDDAPSLTVTCLGLEVRPPPSPLIGLDDPTLADRWTLARKLAPALDARLDPPKLVPWTRKAHELALHAEAAASSGAAARSAIFEAYYDGGRDIGRVDVLVDVGMGLGLDPTETKAVLDVDRHEESVLRARERAMGLGVDRVPTILLGEARLEGFHNRTALRTFLDS